MKLSEIREYPTVLDTSNGKIHESCLRSFQIVAKVLELLDANTPPEVVVEVIVDLANAPNLTKDVHEKEIG